MKKKKRTADKVKIKLSSMQKKLSVIEPKFRSKLKEIFEDLSKGVDMLYDLATLDEKTGLYNARFFNTMIEIEEENAKRGEALSLIVIDIDFFKRINDKIGHIRADDILKNIAMILQKSVRKSDIVTRFGGEEFFILLPNTTINRATKIAERIRKKIKKDLKKHNVTVSCGLSQYKKRDTIQKFKKRADKAVYNAKKLGRDRVELI